MKIGVFDSGVGGKSFVDAIARRFAEAEILYIEDHENLPYGNKTPEQLLRLTVPLFQRFIEARCDAVLVACNTVTTTIINDLRAVIDIPLVGVEPMVKTAAELTRTKHLAVCATPTTLASKRYAELKALYAPDIEIIEPDCSTWAFMIEHNRQNELALHSLMADLLRQDVDIVILGCTHYHWIEDELQLAAGKSCRVIQPIEPVLDQLARVLQS